MAFTTNQVISSSDLQTKVDDRTFVAKYNFPADAKIVTKSEVVNYVYIDTSASLFSSYTSNRCPIYGSLIPLANYPKFTLTTTNNSSDGEITEVHGTNYFPTYTYPINPSGTQTDTQAPIVTYGHSFGVTILNTSASSILFKVDTYLNNVLQFQSSASIFSGQEFHIPAGTESSWPSPIQPGDTVKFNVYQ